MAYSTFDLNAFSYLDTPAVGDLGPYQNSGPMAPVEAASFPPFDHGVNFPEIIGGPNATVGPQPNVFFQHAHDRVYQPSLSHGIPYPTVQNGYFQPIYPGRFQESQPQPAFYGHGMWPGQQAWEEQTRAQLGTSFPSAEGFQAAQATQYPGSVPLSYQGYNPSGFPFDAHRLEAGPTRTELSRARRLRPYGVRPAEHAHVEAGPSRLAPPQPPGGAPATTADADENQKVTEEDKVPKSKRTREPRVKGTGGLNPTAADKDAPRLIKWAKKRKGLSTRLSFCKALAVALKDISTVREAVYEKPHLHVVATGGDEDPSEYAIRERKQREAVRESYEQLSRYYLREEGVWVRPKLLAVVVQDLETSPELRLS